MVGAFFAGALPTMTYGAAPCTVRVTSGIARWSVRVPLPVSVLAMEGETFTVIAEAAPAHGSARVPRGVREVRVVVDTTTLGRTLCATRVEGQQ